MRVYRMYFRYPSPLRHAVLQVPLARAALLESITPLVQDDLILGQYEEYDAHFEEHYERNPTARQNPRGEHAPTLGCAMWCMGDVVHGTCGAWEMWCMGDVVHGRCGAWGMWCMGDVVHGACASMRQGMTMEAHEEWPWKRCIEQFWRCIWWDCGVLCPPGGRSVVTQVCQA